MRGWTATAASRRRPVSPPRARMFCEFRARERGAKQQLGRGARVNHGALALDSKRSVRLGET
eukprot:2110130-Pyramimonas_sp.AAC.1